jgi:hypothetical protein
MEENFDSRYSKAVVKLNGSIWTKVIEREFLEQNELEFNVISSNYNQDNTLNIRCIVLRNQMKFCCGNASTRRRLFWH